MAEVYSLESNYEKVEGSQMRISSKVSKFLCSSSEEKMTFILFPSTPSSKNKLSVVSCMSAIYIILFGIKP